MGYFSNGTEGMIFEEEWCNHCIHEHPEGGPGCPVMLAHNLYNYDQCNQPDSILHLLIARGTKENGFKQECRMFIPTAKTFRGKLPEHLKEWAKQNGIVEIGPVNSIFDPKPTTQKEM